MKLIFTYILSCFLFCACRHENKNKQMDLYFSKEIKDRMRVIRGQQDSMKISPAKIDTDVNNLILMSGDVENSVAVTGRANRYFSSLANTFHLNPNDFTSLSATMDRNDITSLLKENELNFFNQVIFQMKTLPGVTIYTAH
jgi:hypothetical protein